MLTATQCRQTLAPVLLAMGYEYVGCEFFTAGKRSVVRIYIDCEGGITCNDCAKVSEQAMAALTLAQQLSNAYTLEVSSPGLDRPLFSLADFQRFSGQQVIVRLRRPMDGRRNWQGIIGKTTDDGQIVINCIENNTAISVGFDNIEKARLEPDI